MICRDGLVGVAGQIASTNGLEPPLQMIFVVVHGRIQDRAPSQPRPLAAGR
jgi:hypothetical protein